MKINTLIRNLVGIVFLFTACSAFSGCGLNDNDIENYYNLEAIGSVYYEGEQTISIAQFEYSDKKTTFKESVTVADITVSGVLLGKTIKSVQFLSETKLSLTLDGKVKADSSQKEDVGTITVSHNALENGANGNALLRVDFEPKMTVRNCDVESLGVKKSYVSEFKLPYGSFIKENVNKDNIFVPVDDGATVNMSVTDEGLLRIEVIGFEPFEYKGQTYNNPSAKISANVTTFNKDLYVEIGVWVYDGYALY